MTILLVVIFPDQEPACGMENVMICWTMLQSTFSGLK